MEFTVFGILSVIVSVLTVIGAACIQPNQKKRKWDISSLKFVTAGIFLAIFLFFVPICYHWDGWLDDHIYIRPVLLTLINTVRVFLLGIDFDFVENAVPAEPEWFKVLLSLYGMILYVVAPVLTFSNVLAMFKNLSGELRVRICRRQEICIMSELNAQSITLAKSIVQKQANKEGKKPLIVFCDVFTQNEEDNYELLLQAQELSAICLKKDVSHITLSPNGKPVEIFLIGENETENTTQAIRLTNEYKNSSRKISLYVFSSDPTTDYILDSLDLGSHLLSDEFCNWLKDHAQEILQEGKWDGTTCSMFGSFSIHRIDPMHCLVRDVLTIHDYQDYKEIRKAADKNRTVSVTILGLGNHGTQFLKTAVWFYQCYGIDVELNVFDLGDENGDPRQRLGQECPGLVNHPNPTSDGEARYNIEFFPGINCFSADFDNKILVGAAERFDKTNLVFIALGDDDRNIRAARTVENLFALKNVQSGVQLPFIYAIVYDDEKAANLNVRQVSETKKRGIEYVGARLNQYSYDSIKKNLEREEAAIANHLDWLSKECQLRCACMSVTSVQPQEMNEHQLAFKALLEQEQSVDTEIKWGDQDYYYTREDKTIDYEGPVNYQKVKESVEQYMRESYYRKSSLSKAFHQEALSKTASPETTCSTGYGPLCLCDRCQKRRITEHMRWNAYMRSLGYQKIGDHKDHTAKLHKNLTSWHELSWRDRYKD